MITLPAPCKRKKTHETKERIATNIPWETTRISDPCSTESANICTNRKPERSQRRMNCKRASGSKEKGHIVPSIMGAKATVTRHYSKNNQRGGCHELKHKKRNWEVMENECHDWYLVRPFTYIGVFKLSCSACSTWIQVFKGDQGFIRRKPWKMVFALGPAKNAWWVAGYLYGKGSPQDIPRTLPCPRLSQNPFRC